MDDLIADLDGALPAGGGARVLDAGCGTGRLAAALTERGHHVTAVDSDAGAVAAARAAGVPAVHADITRYEGPAGGFDAVVFRLSLHHVEKLDRAVDAAAALLAPGGLLVVDEFAWDRVDAATARWFHGTADLLVAAGAVPAERQHDHPDGGRDADPAGRWRRQHADLHTGTAMLAALARRFPVDTARATPYLHHYLGDWLREDLPTGAALRAELRRQELAGLAGGTLAATGIRLITRRTG
ncbi:MAG: class I SAM-dependent methyltransferase [Mycobacteriales bacterium]